MPSWFCVFGWISVSLIVVFEESGCVPHLGVLLVVELLMGSELGVYWELVW